MTKRLTDADYLAELQRRYDLGQDILSACPFMQEYYPVTASYLFNLWQAR